MKVRSLVKNLRNPDRIPDIVYKRYIKLFIEL
jgi:hypothetical protein